MISETSIAESRWSDEPEQGADLTTRLRKLWGQIEQETGSTVLVTHSNVIQELCRLYLP